MKKIMFSLLIYTLIIFTSCESFKSDKKSKIGSCKKEIDSLNSVISELKTNCYYTQYRYLSKNINYKKLVFGEGYSQNSIYYVEVGYGMGSVDYLYLKKDIDDVPTIVTCIKSSSGMGNQLEYEILDENEKSIEHFFEEENKSEPYFEQKMEYVLERAKERALKLAKSINP